jgi:hypothetical protein
MINLSNRSESLSFNSIDEWEAFCQEVGGVVPVYFWNGKYVVIVENANRVGEHGAVRLGDDRHAVIQYATPGGGTLSYHWEACYRKSYSESRKYWVFSAAEELPQQIDRGDDYWLRSYRQTDYPGLYEAVTEGGVIYPILRKKPARLAV